MFAPLNNSAAIPSSITVLTNAVLGINSPVVPANTVIILTNFIVANVTGAPHTFSLHLHLVGVAPVAANAICLAVPIAANTMYMMGPIVISAGYQLSGVADANTAINICVGGYILNEATA